MKWNLGAIDNRNVGRGQSRRNACLLEPHLEIIVEIAGQLRFVAENFVLRHIFIQAVGCFFLRRQALSQVPLHPQRALVFIAHLMPRKLDFLVDLRLNLIDLEIELLHLRMLGTKFRGHFRTLRLQFD